MTKKPTKKDLETQLSLALDEVIALKEERNNLRESHANDLANVNRVANQTLNALGLIHLRAETVNNESFFGNSFAAELSKSNLLEDAQVWMENLAKVTKKP